MVEPNDDSDLLSDQSRYSHKETESDMRFDFIDDALREQWPKDLIDTEHVIDAGEIKIDPDTGKHWREDEKWKVDYGLRLNEKYVVGIVEAKSQDESYDEGMNQAMKYAEKICCKFAYATNGKEINKEKNYGIKEYDYIKKKFTIRGTFPTVDELTHRLREGGFGNDLEMLIEPPETVKHPLRFYQMAAFNAAMEAISKGQKKILLNLATGTGKTKIAYQIARKLWKHYKEPNGNPQKILFITDRDALVSQAMKNDFKPFENQMHRLIGKKNTSFDIYFTLYQSLDVDKDNSESESDIPIELYKLYDKDFFKFIIIDECHRGAQSQGGKWQDILAYFDKAIHIGMTATPKRDADSVETFEYFGEPVYVYSEREAVKDGFLAPHFRYNIDVSHDVNGYMPQPGELGINNQPLEDRIYGKNDFDKNIRVINRQKEVAQYILNFLNTSPNTPFDKTILFCRNQQHANEMRHVILNESKKDPKYCVRITSNEKDRKATLANFCDVKETYPVIAVTSKLMTTGVDAQMCKLIVLDTFVHSKTELKQIIGRGTRIYADSKEMEKYYFTIMDFRGSTIKLDDPDWDSPPISKPSKEKKPGKGEEREKIISPIVEGEKGEVIRVIKKIYNPNSESGYDYEEFSEHLGNAIRTLSGPMIEDFKQLWLDLEKRKTLVSEFKSKGISIENIRELDVKSMSYDVFDILVKLAFPNEKYKPKLRSIRADQAKKDKIFFEKYPEKARDVLNVLLEHYAEYGFQELEDRKVLQLQKFQKFGSPKTILTDVFKSPDVYDNAIKELMIRIYD
jgi:type I restriction enzyme, R subunit